MRIVLYTPTAGTGNRHQTSHHHSSTTLEPASPPSHELSHPNVRPLAIESDESGPRSHPMTPAKHYRHNLVPLLHLGRLRRPVELEAGTAVAFADAAVGVGAVDTSGRTLAY